MPRKSSRRSSSNHRTSARKSSHKSRRFRSADEKVVPDEQNRPPIHSLADATFQIAQNLRKLQLRVIALEKDFVERKEKEKERKMKQLGL
jgi:hypothetical protein